MTCDECGNPIDPDDGDAMYERLPDGTPQKGWHGACWTAMEAWHEMLSGEDDA